MYLIQFLDIKMADSLYPKFKEKLMSKEIDMVLDTIKVVLVKSTYQFNDTHEFASDVGDSNVAGTFSAASTISGTKTVTNGIFNSSEDTEVFAGINDGTINAYLIYKDTGSLATSPLIGYFDSPSQFPFTVSGTTNINLNKNALGYFVL